MLGRGGSGGGLGCEGSGRAVTNILTEEEQGCIKQRNNGGGGSGRGLRQDGEVVIILTMERNRADSERGGKSGVVGAGKIHRNGALVCGLERVSL